MTRDRFEKILTAISTGTAITDARNRFEKICSAIASKIGEGGSGGIDYSTSEVNTGIKWIDEKTIYRKVIQTTITGETTNIDISQLQVESLVNSFSYVINTSETERAGVIINVPCYDSESYTCQLNYDIPNDKIIIYSGSGIITNYTSCTIIIEYTKAVS